VQSFIDKHNLQVVRFDGCALGVKSLKDGTPIRKPWKVATSMKGLVDSLSPYRCDGKHEHVTCRGADAKNSENYSPEMARVVHRAFA